MNKILYTLGTSVELHTENEVQLGTVFLKVTRFSYICMNLYEFIYYRMKHTHTTPLYIQGLYLFDN
jgi:hypothetical protein